MKLHKISIEEYDKLGKLMKYDYEYPLDYIISDLDFYDLCKLPKILIAVLI